MPFPRMAGREPRTVPVSENIDIVEKRYRALGGSIKVIRKPGVNHHPHSLREPGPIVNFVLSTHR